MTANDALMAKVRAAAKVLRAKEDLRRPMPAIQRLRSVARINALRRQFRTGHQAIPPSPSMATNREHHQ